MKLLLVRHGQPQPEGTDPGLTESGAELVQRHAARCKDNRITVVQIRHSVKKRAEETAHILAEHLNPLLGVVEISGLKPNDDVVPIAEVLQLEKDNVAYVGHLPFLGILVDLLLNGAPGGDDMCGFSYATMVCLSRENGKWSIDWTIR